MLISPPTTRPTLSFGRNSPKPRFAPRLSFHPLYRSTYRQLGHSDSHDAREQHHQHHGRLEHLEEIHRVGRGVERLLVRRADFEGEVERGGRRRQRLLAGDERLDVGHDGVGSDGGDGDDELGLATSCRGEAYVSHGKAADHGAHDVLSRLDVAAAVSKH